MIYNIPYRIDPVFGTKKPIPDYVLNISFPRPVGFSKLDIALKTKASERTEEESRLVQEHETRRHLVETNGMPLFTLMGSFRIPTLLSSALRKHARDRDKEEHELVQEYWARNGAPL
jgi:hypothetical protein